MREVGLIALLVLVPCDVVGQLSGRVLTDAGSPLPNAVIQIWGSAELMADLETDRSGRFVSDLPLERVRRASIHHLGYGVEIVGVDQFRVGPVEVVMHGLPVALPMLEVTITSDICAESEDSGARQVWEAARRRYSAETRYRGGAAETRGSFGHVRAESVGRFQLAHQQRQGWQAWVGATDDSSPGRYRVIERIIAERGYAWGQRSASVGRRVLNWVYPLLEGRHAYHFATPEFGRGHAFHVVAVSSSHTELAFCPKSASQASIQGRLVIASDSTFLSARWTFVTDAPIEGAGGEVLFGEATDSEGEVHLVSARGIFWRHDGEPPMYEGISKTYVQLVRVTDQWRVSVDAHMPDVSDR